LALPFRKGGYGHRLGKLIGLTADPLRYAGVALSAEPVPPLPPADVASPLAA
jgi:hypothetical protein